MAVAVLMGFSAYLRPSELIKLLASSLVRPLPGSQFWALHLNPIEKLEPSKAGAFDDTILMDGSQVMFLNSAYEQLLSLRSPMERLFPWSYGEFLECFRQSAVAIGVPELAPYHMRHSGASWDRLQNLRSIDQVQRRGRWASHRNMLRYEKHGRMVSAFNSLPKVHQLHALECERKIVGLLSGQEKYVAPQSKA